MAGAMHVALGGLPTDPVLLSRKGLCRQRFSLERLKDDPIKCTLQASVSTGGLGLKELLLISHQ